MINFNIINKNIVGSVNGKTFSTAYTEDLWESLTKLNTKFQRATTMEEAKELMQEAQELVTSSPKKDIESVTQDLTYNANTDTYHLKYKGKVSPVPLPKSLVDKILYAKDNDLPVTPLVKFAVRALRSIRVTKNPKDAVNAAIFLERVCDYSFQTFVSPSLYEMYTEEHGFSHEVATEQATVPQTPITMEGLLCTKKVVSVLWDKMRYKYEKDAEGNPKKVLRNPNDKKVDEETGEISWKEPEFSEDYIFEPAIKRNTGDAFSCGKSLKKEDLGHIIRVGNETRLPSWDCVDLNDNRICSKGLHTGNQDYIKFWELSDNVTLECLVDPSQIGAIPTGDGNKVLRVKELQVLAIKDREVDNKNLYHSSTYAALQDKRWAEYRQEIIERYETDIAELVAKIEKEKEALIA